MSLVADTTLGSLTFIKAVGSLKGSICQNSQQSKEPKDQKIAELSSATHQSTTSCKLMGNPFMDHVENNPRKYSWALKA